MKGWSSVIFPARQAPSGGKNLLFTNVDPEAGHSEKQKGGLYPLHNFGPPVPGRVRAAGLYHGCLDFSVHSSFHFLHSNALVLQLAFSQSSFARRVVIMLVVILLWGCYPCGSFGGCCDFVVLDWTPSGIAFLAVKGQLVKRVPSFAA